MDIENIRFSNEIQSSVTIDDTLNINTIKIPSLILQPFIENAIWHGLSPKKGLKKIDITFEKEADTFLKITIADNGIGRAKSNEIKKQKIHKKDSIGIKLTEERLNNFCKDFENDYSLNFIDLFDSNNNSTGTKLILSIPLF
jgi:sensor histidine kinase YesM